MGEALITSPRVGTIETTISSGTSLSPEVDLRGNVLVGIIMPQFWGAAGLSFQASDTSGGTYWVVDKDDGTELTLTVSASRHIVIDPSRYIMGPYIKLRSGTSAATVNQGADRVIKLLVEW